VRRLYHARGLSFIRELGYQIIKTVDKLIS
jgi:hypothetical protein